MAFATKSWIIGLIISEDVFVLKTNRVIKTPQLLLVSV